MTADPLPVVSSSGWKLNPVVGAVYAPELYAGKLSLSLPPPPPEQDRPLESKPLQRRRMMAARRSLFAAGGEREKGDLKSSTPAALIRFGRLLLPMDLPRAAD